MTRSVSTYSIVARDQQTGQIGVAVQSRYFSVGSIVPWAEAGVGAVATQGFQKVDYGPDGLALMRRGLSARQALEALLENDPGREARQVEMIDAAGNAAAHTGALCVAATGHLVGDSFAVQASMMIDDSVLPAMKAAYEAAGGDLAGRLIAALEGAQAAGGDIRGQQSSALIVVTGDRSEKPWEGRVFDLRVEDHSRPVEELKRLVRLKRAYHSLDRAADHMTAQRFVEAAAAVQEGLDIAPEAEELRIWLAVALYSAGQEEEALRLFRQVFAETPLLAELVRRLAPLGMLPAGEAALQRIMDQRPVE
jgi:uncharacterized Ntn-hydrolase superfamily protein